MARSKRGLCRLHQEERTLFYGHITPRFVFRWQGVGLRGIENPNIPRQDGPRRHLLCADCEALFSGWETRVQRAIFEPLHDEEATEFEYGSWLAKFAASLVFRVLVVTREEGALAEFAPATLANVDDAISTWRDFLIGTRDDPGSHSVHAFVLHPIEDREQADLWEPGINRYIGLAVGNDVVQTAQGCYVLAKMGQLLIVGVVENRGGWDQGRIDPVGGVLGRDKFDYPGWMRDRFNQKVAASIAAFERISARQRQRIKEDMADRPRRRIRLALRRDLNVFGIRALMRLIRPPDQS